MNFPANQDSFYVVAEIGCNHQGSVDTACKMIEEAGRAGADAVKFQKRSNSILFGDCIYSAPYDNRNSYGLTYGEHREFLELSTDDFLILKKCSQQHNLDFQVTPFDFESLDECERIGVGTYKIASADVHFPQLVQKVCKTGKPVFISTGGASEAEIDATISIMRKYHQPKVIYHCTAAYPVSIEDMNLLYIKKLIHRYQPEGISIGLSDHENGIDAAPIAYMLGARVFEKHFTLDRSWKGTDQSFSLEPAGLTKLIRNLGRIENMLGSGQKFIYDSEKKPLSKMIKSCVYTRNLKSGHILDANDITFRVVKSAGIRPSEVDIYIGQQLTIDVAQGSALSINDF